MVKKDIQWCERCKFDEGCSDVLCNKTTNNVYCSNVSFSYLSGKHDSKFTYYDTLIYLKIINYIPFCLKESNLYTLIGLYVLEQ